MKPIEIKTEYIKLDQFLKLAGIADSGAHAKILIIEKKVKVNDQTETQRGKKLRKGDTIEVSGELFRID